MDTGISIVIDQKGTSPTADDEYIISAKPTGTGLSSTYNVSGDITKTGVAYGTLKEIGRITTATTSISYLLKDAVSNGCSFADAKFNLKANTCLLLPNILVVCSDAGTPNNTGDDTYSISLNPTGSGNGTTYNVSGDITATGVAYGSAQQIATGLLISSGSRTITIKDATSAECQLLNIKIDPPIVCSCTGMAKLELTNSVNLSEAKVGDNIVYTIKVKNTGAVASSVIEVLDKLGSSLQFISATSGTYNSTTGIWAVGVLPVNGEATLSITAKLLDIGVTQNQAEITVGGNNDCDGIVNNLDVVCTTVPIELCPGSSFTASAPSGYSDIQWYKNGVSISGATSSSLIIDVIGNYFFTAKEIATGCSVDGCCPIKIIAGVLCTPVVQNQVS
jgi:uncharacterized repeat protein (TIGR01451 family)